MAMILVVEDDANILNLIRLYLERDGFAVTGAPSGTQALELLRTREFDACVLDVMLPGMSGLDVLKTLRNAGNATPVLIVSARNQDAERIEGLSLGADDYLGKPFNPNELVARVHALLRRSASGSSSAPTTLRAGSLELDTASCTLRDDGRSVPLTPMEYRILHALMRAPGRVFTKAQLYEAASGEEAAVGAEAAMMVHISNLRAKIDGDPARPSRIETVRGLGYRLDA